MSHGTIELTSGRRRTRTPCPCEHAPASNRAPDLTEVTFQERNPPAGLRPACPRFCRGALFKLQRQDHPDPGQGLGQSVSARASDPARAAAHPRHPGRGSALSLSYGETVGRGGREPPASSRPGWRSSAAARPSELSPGKHGRGDSNPQQTAPKAVATTIELRPSASDRNRTCGIQFGKLALYLLSYAREQERGMGVEPTSLAWEARAQPPRPTSRFSRLYPLVPLKGVEPSSNDLKGRCSAS